MIRNQIIDDAGQNHDPAGIGARILSLVPSLTELLFEMELSDHLIGRTSFCVHPQTMVNTVPSVGGTKRINMEKVATLRPTHALVNIDETPKQMADTLANMGITVVVTHPIEVADNRNLFNLIGALFDRHSQARALTARLDAALGDFDNNATLRTALYLIWKSPWMTISQDTYISRFLSIGGWQTIPHNPTIRYPEIEINNSLLDKVDDVLFSSEPFTFTDAHISVFNKTFANHAQKVRRIDGEMVSWYGSRAIQGLSYLKEFSKKARQV